MKVKSTYFKPKQIAWNTLKRAGDRAELYQYYKPRMDFIRSAYEEKDYMMLNLYLRDLKKSSIEFAKKGMGFAVTEELFYIMIELLRVQGMNEYADVLVRETTEELMIPIIGNEEA